MSVLPEKNFITPEEYLAIERVSPVKHEFFNGEMFQMAGSSLQHARISKNITIALGIQFKDGTCESFNSDLRVFIPATGLYTYPDVVAVCGEPEMADDNFDILLNPVLIIEVLSASTQRYDKGEKFEHYRTIESLKEYVLVWQDKKRVARHTISENGSWVLTDFIGEEAMIELVSVECTLSMEDIYDKVKID